MKLSGGRASKQWHVLGVTAILTSDAALNSTVTASQETDVEFEKWRNRQGKLLASQSFVSCVCVGRNLVPSRIMEGASTWCYYQELDATRNVE
jgi:hypothetical protein